MEKYPWVNQDMQILHHLNWITLTLALKKKNTVERSNADIRPKRQQPERAGELP